MRECLRPDKPQRPDEGANHGVFLPSPGLTTAVARFRYLPTNVVGVPRLSIGPRGCAQLSTWHWALLAREHRTHPGCAEQVTGHRHLGHLGRWFWKSPSLCHNMKERLNTVPARRRIGNESCYQLVRTRMSAPACRLPKAERLLLATFSRSAQHPSRSLRMI